MAEQSEPFDDEVRVEYRLGATVNTGDFNNVRPEYAISANVRPGEHPKATRARLKATIVEWLQEDIDESRGK